MNVHPGRISRRRLLASCGGGATAALCGCLGGSDEPTYREGQIDQSGGDPRTADQMVAAEAIAVTEATEAANPLDSLAVESHEFVLEDGYKGPTVQGVVSNTGSDPIKFAEVRVRVYGTDGAQLGRYLATTGDLAGNADWQFEVILLSSVSDAAKYDIAVLGIPA